MNIALDKIKIVTDRFRVGTPDAGLVESIRTIGLINPLVINKKNELIAGHRRYLALKELGVKTVPVLIIDKSDLHQELIALDENLQRLDLREAAWSKAIARRKQIYEELFPETKAKVAAGKASGRVRAGTSAKTALVQKTFTKDVSDRTGVPQRTIQKGIARGEKSASAVMKAWEKMEIGSAQVDELITLPKADQEALLPVVIDKSSLEVREIVACAKEHGIEKAIMDSRLIDDAKKAFKQMVQTADKLTGILRSIISDKLVFEGCETIEVLRCLSGVKTAASRVITLHGGVK